MWGRDWEEMQKKVSTEGGLSWDWVEVSDTSTQKRLDSRKVESPPVAAAVEAARPHSLMPVC